MKFNNTLVVLESFFTIIMSIDELNVGDKWFSWHLELMNDVSLDIFDSL